MGLWDWWQGLFVTGAGAFPNTTTGTPNTVGPAPVSPGDPHGVELEPATGPMQTRMAAIVPSGWAGYPAGWGLTWDNGGGKLENLVDTAWAALDLNSSVLSSMPVYRIRNGEILPPTSWMTNPDPSIYTSWAEFAKQLFWEYQLGEAFVLPMARDATGFPFNFRVIPQWLVNVEMAGGTRAYSIGQLDVTGEILHIRYKSSTDQARGMGPLETGRARLVAAATLARYASEIAQGGGVPKYVLEVEKTLNPKQSDELLEQWWASRMANLGEPWKPAVLSGGAKAKPLEFSPEQLTLHELSQYTESRIAVLCGVPPFLLGLPSGGDSMTYKNVDSLFDYHDRASLHPKATHVMTALSGWAVPRGQNVELNRDEYTRPPFAERVAAYAQLATIPDVITAKEIRTMERFAGTDAAEALTGGT